MYVIVSESLGLFKELPTRPKDGSAKLSMAVYDFHRALLSLYVLIRSQLFLFIAPYLFMLAATLLHASQETACDPGSSGIRAERAR